MQYINGYICRCLALFFISGCIRLPEYHILQFHTFFFIIRFQVFHDSRSKVRKIPSKGLYRMLPIFALKKLFQGLCYIRKNICYTKEKDVTCTKVSAIGAKMRQAENT